MGDAVLGIWLASKYKAGHTLPKRLYEKFGSFENIYSADIDDYLQAGFTINEISPLLGKSTDYAKRICAFCASAKTDIIVFGDEKYPKSLYTIPDCPPVLFCRGTLPDFNKYISVTMVGTREMSRDGALTAHKISFEAASGGATVVSGFAHGIDSAVHRGALDAEGKTVAVLGCGIDVDYPFENTALKEEIISSGGAVITEFFPPTEPMSSNFPIRNRVLSALSHCTVIIEAPLGSGALITANRASEQGKKIFAVPGSVSSKTCEGSNLLLKEGISAVLDGYDILRELDVLFPNTATHKTPKKEYFIPSEIAHMAQNAVIPDAPYRTPTVNRGDELEGIPREIYEKILKNGVATAEEMVNDTLPLGKVLYILTRLEADGYISVVPGGGYKVRNT